MVKHNGVHYSGRNLLWPANCCIVCKDKIPHIPRLWHQGSCHEKEVLCQRCFEQPRPTKSYAVWCRVCRQYIFV